MKTINYIFPIIAILLSGCDLGSIKEWGPNCPENEDGYLSYILTEGCTAESEIDCPADFSNEFKYGRCPKLYPICVKDRPKDTDHKGYHCEKDKEYINVTTDECDDNDRFLCGDNCIDPHNAETCGADNCDTENYGGINCTALNPQNICVKYNDEYQCVLFGNLIKCGEQSINPNYIKTCGAKNCTDDNYGGKDCTADPQYTDCYKEHCVFSYCTSGTHPVYLDSYIIDCKPNTAEECAAFDLPEGVLPTDCASKAADNHAAEMTCDINSTCKVLKCLDGYHPNVGSEKCEPNTDVLCSSAESSTTLNCNDAIEHSDVTECKDGACAVKQCKPGFYLSDDSSSCLPAAPDKCAPVNISSPVNCNNTIANSAKTACTNGQCTVSQCQPGYHPSHDNKKCDKTTDSSCAPVNSNNPLDCNTAIANSAKIACTNGQCTVSQCQPGYHPSPDNKKCDKTGASSCAPVNSNSPKDCTKQPITKECKSDGSACVCSKDGSKVLNYDKTACVPKICDGIPGVATGRKLDKNYFSGAKDSVCRPITCVSGYKLETQDGGAICHPLLNSSRKSCDPLGYKVAKPSSKICKACSSTCSVSYCKPGYKYYIAGCLPLDSCCGKTSIKNTKNGKYYQCTNCKAEGKKCNGSTGTCVK